MGDDLLSRLDRARWSRAHWLIFASTAIGFFLWGIINTMGYAFFPTYSSVAYIVTVAATPLLGDLILSRISDRRLGRKSTYIITMGLYALGIMIDAAALLLMRRGLAQEATFLAGYGLAMFGVEGEVPIGLALLAEVSPVKHRQRVLILSPNFENIGAAAAAALAFAIANMDPSGHGMSPFTVATLAIAGMAAAGLVAAVVLRALMPESIRWLTARGLEERARREASRLTASGEDNVSISNRGSRRLSLRSRFGFLTVWALANYLTWGLMAFVLADYYLHGSQIYLDMLFANLGASAAAVAALFLDRMDSRNFVLLAFSAATASFAPILAYTLLGLSSPALFYGLTFLNLFFITFTWWVRTIHEPLLFPTEDRAFMIGSVRAIAMAAYTASTYITFGANEWAFALYGMAWQAVGLASAALWRRDGFDVRLRSLDAISAPAPRVKVPAVSPAA